MKYLYCFAWLVLGMVFSDPAGAEGFVDIFGGNTTFSAANTNESVYQVNAATQYNYASQNNSIPNSATGGFRIGGLHKWDHFSLGGAFVLEDYSAMADYPYPTNPSFSASLKNQQGGNVLQPGADLMIGVPLKFVRLYGGFGLTTPIMFYNYTSYDRAANTIDPNASGSSMALGYNLFIGARWLISDHFNMFIEDRFSSLLTSMVVKNSFYNSTYGYYNSSFTYNNLDANRIVFGLGYAW